MVGDLLSAGFTFIDRRVGQRAYSRKLETEADSLGLEVRLSIVCCWPLVHRVDFSPLPYSSWLKLALTLVELSHCGKS